jgi:hypothetical protein
LIAPANVILLGRYALTWVDDSRLEAPLALDLPHLARDFIELNARIDLDEDVGGLLLTARTFEDVEV